MAEVLLIFLSTIGSCFVCACLVGMFWPKKKPEADPILPSELDDWDAEFVRLTGKSIWQARCEADPELRKSAMQLGSAQNNINPFYNAQLQGLQNQALLQGNAFAQQSAQLQGPWSTLLAPGLSGLLGGAVGQALGNPSKHPKS